MSPIEENSSSLNAKEVQINEISHGNEYDTCEGSIMSTLSRSSLCEIKEPISDRQKMIENNCVICLEEYDENHNACVPHSKHMIAECKCAYFVHPSCFRKWIRNRPTKSVNCILCASEGTLVMSYNERIEVVMKTTICRRTIIFAMRIFCWMCIFISIWEIVTFMENMSDEYYYEDDFRDDKTNTQMYYDDFNEQNGRATDGEILI